MNIKQAKEQIKNAMTAYFTKDQFGNYKIPIEKQRPIFLMGPPGIGKTAIMEQIATELHYSWQHVHRLHAKALDALLQRINRKSNTNPSQEQQSLFSNEEE